MIGSLHVDGPRPSITLECSLPAALYVLSSRSALDGIVKEYRGPRNFVAGMSHGDPMLLLAWTFIGEMSHLIAVKATDVGLSFSELTVAIAPELPELQSVACANATPSWIRCD
jgi:hypothetical protein